MSAVKRNGLECLVLSGAFDCFEEIKREQYFAPNAKGEIFIDVLIRYATGYQVAMKRHRTVCSAEWKKWRYTLPTSQRQNNGAPWND
jgi:hypothetical protein